MNIAVVTPYGDTYAKDKLFDESACKIGQNLLLPEIKLKGKLEALGHQYHTADMYELADIDLFVFKDLNGVSSLLTLDNAVDFLKYVLKRKWRSDYLLKMKRRDMNGILVAQEPPVIYPKSYDARYHSMFSRVVTWNTDMLTEEKYVPFYYPQVMPAERILVPYSQKRFAAVICSNKTASYQNELYSERRRVIDWFENSADEFDLYGVGWEQAGICNYKGKTDDKLKTLSGYRFSFCYENMTGIKGYITEKMFDCFFANVVPVYWGADNITDFVPKNCFIDRREYDSMEALVNALHEMTEEEYNGYLENIRAYLESDAYSRYFSVESYVERMARYILEK